MFEKSNKGKSRQKKKKEDEVMLFNINDASIGCFTAGIPFAGCFSFGK